ncbi:helix-turn-helix domain-containing protein [Rhizobium lusitanum]|uniref:Helix-turn-helix domain-containing protein n=1 Tax=Rhizobium lusitanum TaxID=293958 RepID=A0A6L9UK00_9HYPH|nr:helix-turn-helix domain-containing protein [Rhizobium lusitanum]
MMFREREEIALQCAWGICIRVIARKLGRTPSTISREIRRNSAPRNSRWMGQSAAVCRSARSRIPSGVRR